MTTVSAIPVVNGDQITKVTDIIQDVSSTHSDVVDTKHVAVSQEREKDKFKDLSSLKRTWLNLLPLEQLINLTLELDEHVSVDIREKIWPSDLQAAVIEAAVATLAASQDNEKAAQALNDYREKGNIQQDGRLDNSTPIESLAPKDHSPMPLGPVGSAPISITPASAPPSYPHPSQSAKTTSSNSPATSTTPYHMAATTSYTYTYPYGGYPYTHPGNSQPYAYSYGPASATSQDDDEDLPSYEEMLVQALQAHNDPNGTAPKQLFQWMAATYPLQANFRPSASQALQKAFKRGRFEKNKEGKYRLNASWEGGNTTRRTTRRPQSYSKAVTNPCPSSHPPANSQAYPPQCYTWQYGGKKLPRPPSHSASPVPTTPAPHITASLPNISPVSNDLGAAHNTEGLSEADAESARDCWEAAQSILQALNLTSGYSAFKSPNEQENVEEVVQDEAPQTDVTKTSDTDGVPKLDKEPLPSINSTQQKPPVDQVRQDTMPFPPPVIASDINFSISQPAPNHPPMNSLPLVSSTSPLGTVAEPNISGSDISTSRAALQGTLALLAAQLADIATAATTGNDTVGSSSEWPTLAEAAAATTSSIPLGLQEVAVTSQS